MGSAGLPLTLSLLDATEQIRSANLLQVIYDNILDARIRLQKCASSANGLPGVCIYKCCNLTEPL